MARDDKDKDPERGGRIRERRLAVRGRTQAQLARLLGVGERTFQGWEAGYTVPAVKLPILAHALGTTPEYLLGETDDPTGGADLDQRLARLEALTGALADDRISGEQSARAGFDAVAKLVSALTKDLERRLDAQAETLSTLHAQLEEIRRAPQVQEAQDRAESDKPEGSKRIRGKDRRRPDQANG
jgi:transcriptional regulator with XRE-family HTH domain